jgi:hypothetical protein
LSFAKKFFWGAAIVFVILGGVSFFKKKPESKETEICKVEEIAIAKEEKPVVVEKNKEKLPEEDCIAKLFALDNSKLPIVETVTYTSRVPWLKGRPAWIGEYASHYETSKHFIARSLNRKADYFTQKVRPGDRFNVLKKELSFYLLIDLGRSKLWFYALDGEKKERILLKTYNVGLGRKDSSRASGFLTPCGKFMLGSNITVYKPGVMGYFRDQKQEMIRVFGTRWIPFSRDINGSTDNCKGLGLHGAPWVEDSKTHELIEDRSLIGQYDSDGCIRLNSEDVEEIYAIVATKPTMVEIVNDFFQASPPEFLEKQ